MNIFTCSARWETKLTVICMSKILSTVILKRMEDFRFVILSASTVLRRSLLTQMRRQRRKFKSEAFIVSNLTRQSKISNSNQPLQAMQMVIKEKMMMIKITKEKNWKRNLKIQKQSLKSWRQKKPSSLSRLSNLKDTKQIFRLKRITFGVNSISMRSSYSSNKSRERCKQIRHKLLERISKSFKRRPT